LACKSSVAVHLNRDYTLSVHVSSSKEVLLSPHSATHNGVHCLKVRRIGKKSYFDFFATITVGPSEGGTEMVLDVSCTLETMST
jgi:hypothetical protein